jgi:hypothetical protein
MLEYIDKVFIRYACKIHALLQSFQTNLHNLRIVSERFANTVRAFSKRQTVPERRLDNKRI